MEDLSQLRRESGVFWVELDKIRTNPMQPRRDFDEARLGELAGSIKQYGVLQPLVVSRQEREVPTGAVVDYEIIAGERRWRASRLAGLSQVPVVIREDPSEKVKLELALIENLQREDLTPMERAGAFKQLVEDFKMRHREVGVKVGKSREYVSNTIRLLTLPEEIQEGLRSGLINEGHTRPILSLLEKKEQQMALYKDIIYRKMTVREAEDAGRELVKKHTLKIIRAEREDSESKLLQEQLSVALGTKVSVEKKGLKKRVSIEFASEEDIKRFLDRVGAIEQASRSVQPEPIIPSLPTPVPPDLSSEALPDRQAGLAQEESETEAKLA